MSDRSSRPHHQPRRTAAEVEAEVPRLRRRHRIGPLRLAVRLADPRGGRSPVIEVG